MSIRARLQRIEKYAKAAALERIRAAPPEELDRLLTEMLEQRARQVEGTHGEHLRMFSRWLQATKHQHPQTQAIARAVWHGPLDDEQLETFNYTEVLS